MFLATVLREMVSPVGTEVREDPRRPVDLVGVAVEPRRFLLDVLPPNHAVRRLPVEPDVVAGSGHLEQANHAGDSEIGLFRQNQFECFTLESDASWAKKMDAFLETTDQVSGPRSLSATEATRPVPTP